MTKTELLDSFYDFSSFFEVVEAIANDETKKRTTS